MTVAELRTAAWHGDRPLRLELPAGWRVSVLRPSTPLPLSQEQIAVALDRPVGQAPIRELARGHLRRPSPLPRGGGRVLPAGLPRTGPGDADVVIANAYPIDVSLTFMRSKGLIPLLLARADALARVDREQDGRRDLEVVVYPCAPLQVLEPAGQPATAAT